LIGSRAIEVELACSEIDVSCNVAYSMRKQLLVIKALGMHDRLLKDERTMGGVRRDFEARRRPILEISKTHDLPPMGIVKSILTSRILSSTMTGRNNDGDDGGGRTPGPRAIIRSIMNDDDADAMGRYLSGWEISQLRIARENDILHNDESAQEAGCDWERTVYEYLDACGIRYVAEDELRRYGRDRVPGAGTPDCLLLDDVYVRGKRVRWIEFKSFYASGLRRTSRFTRKAVGRQVEKYGRAYGTDGAVIMKHGFSSAVSERYPTTLFLDGGSLNVGDGFDFI
jgi:hypothetical protein